MSLTWADHVIWIFNMAMVDKTTIFFSFFHFLKNLGGAMLFHIILNFGRSHRGLLPIVFRR